MQKGWKHDHFAGSISNTTPRRPGAVEIPHVAARVVPLIRSVALWVSLGVAGVTTVE